MTEKQFVADGGKLKLMFEFIPDENHRKLLCECVDRCRLPIQPPARIEAAIRYFDNADLSLEPLTDKEAADLLRWALGQSQPTWADEDFGLAPPASGREEEK